MKTSLLLIAILLIGAPHALTQQTSSSDSGLPKGDWVLACGPSRSRGALVDLYMVGSDSSKGVKVTDVWLENRSVQDVEAVKIGWKLYERSKPQVILLSGETPQFLGVALAAGEKRVVTFPVVSFAKIHRPLLRGGKVNGNYRIELWVSDVQFDNGNLATKSPAYFNVQKAAWTANSSLKFIAVASEPAAKDDDEFGCPNQECGWASSQNCYTCFNNNGSTCSWSNCTYCKSGRCPGLIE